MKNFDKTARNGIFRKIYGLYDNDYTLVFTGTAEECVAYVGCTKTNTLFSALYQHCKLKGKYYVELVDLEEITERTCNCCGRTLPVSKFRINYRKNGTTFASKICNNCYGDYVKNLRGGKKNENN